MTIRQRGQFYEYGFMENGRRYSGTFNGGDGQPLPKSKQAARDYESIIRLDVRAGKHRKEVGLEDFAKFFDEVYMKYSKEHKADWNHDQFRGEVLKHFFAGLTFFQITPLLIVKYISERLQSTTVRKRLRSPNTVHHEVSLLSSIFNMAIAEGVAKENPCRSLPKSAKKKLAARSKRNRFFDTT